MDRRLRPQPSVDDLLSMSFDEAPLVQTTPLTANPTPTGDPNIPSFANFAAFPPIQPIPKAFDTPALPHPGTQFREANSATDSQSPSIGSSSIEQKAIIQKSPRTVDTPQIADNVSSADFDDGASVRTGLSTGTVSRRGSRRYVSKSQKIASIQSIFTESQKIAYAGLCYVCAVEFKAHRFPKSKKMAELYEKWAKSFMAKVFIYLDVSDEEQHMIRQLAEHGIKPSDLATTLVEDAKKTAAKLQKQQREQQSRLQDALDQGLPPPEDDENLATEDREEAEPSDIRYVVLSHLYIICISDGFYDARSRMLLRMVAGYLRVPWADVIQLEKAIADQLRLAENSEDLKKDDSTVERRNKLEARRRWLYMGLASLAGGAVIGLTAGLAAPFIGAGIGAALSTVGISAGAGVTGALTSTTGIAIITSTGVLTGGGKVDTPVTGAKTTEEIRPPKQTNVLITVAGWLTFNEDDYTLPFSTLTPGVHGDQYTLIWESKDLKVLGSTLTIIVSEMASFLVQQGIQAFALPTLMAALTGPLWALKLSYLIDNPWGNGLSKAKKAGKVLADALLNQVQENRPVTLIGYSLGARVIFFCLRELAQKNAVGIVEEAYLFGCPVMATKDEWRQIASVVSTRILNGYLNNDYVLGVLYRASSAVWKEVAGLRPVEGVPGVENIQLDDMLKGHLEYRMGMPRILERVGFSIDADWFEDVEDEEERERQEFEEMKRREREEKARKKKEEAEARKR
ncbi:hypothetical protein BJ742DRAFT_884980, partial [Cladochytrium replicatum]